MTQPTQYNRQYNFTDYQSANPDEPLPAPQVDAEYNAIRVTLSQTLANLALIQRDDGRLANQSVGKDTLDASALALIGLKGFTPNGDWTALTAYLEGDLVDFNDATYVSLEAHTSGAVFDTDLAASKWLLIANAALLNNASAVDLFIGDGTQTVFTTTYSYSGNTAAKVYVNGLLQRPVTDYTISGTTVTFTNAPPAPAIAGQNNIVVWGSTVEVQAAVQAAEAASANAQGYANAAAASAAAALTSENNADTSEAAALASQTAAAASQAAAASSASSASTSATNAASSASSASTSAATATTKAAEALASQTAAAASQTAAATSASQAATSATNSANSAAAASTSATAAAGSASNASSSATSASNSATAAATSATNSASSAASASASATSATNSASTATTKAADATAAASAAATSEANALTSKNAAQTSATNAATSEADALTSKNAAATSAANALTSENNAATSAVSAASSAASAAAALDNFDDRYLGSKTSDPALDNDGNPLVTGALYFNTVDGVMKIYTGSGWIAASSATVATLVTYEFVATAGQTVFSGADANGLSLSYVAPALVVTLNGLRLRPGDDYTATSGTSITLVSAAAVGDELVVDAFGNFLVANTYTIAQADATFEPIQTPASQAEMEAGTAAVLRSMSPLRIAQAIQSLGLNSTYYDQSALFSGSQTNLVLPNINVIVDGALVRIAGSTLALGTSGNWDNSSFATAANRAGKDFYVYALKAGGVILSNNSTFPTGYSATNSRKIGGFHCLCVAVGTISGHTLTGYVAGDILPRSVWDRCNRSSARQEGTILSRAGVWVDIYLPSVSGSTLVSVNNGTIADGASSPAFHCYKFEQWFARQGMKSISQLEFFAASDGANQGTNITGSSDPSTTTGHTDTSGRRMISNEGVEDACGVLWQWTRDQGGVMTSAAWANAFDGNDSGVGGQHHQAPYRGLLGGAWGDGSRCGSRASAWADSPLSLASGYSGRGVAEPANNRF